MDWYEVVTQLAQIILALVAGIGAVPLVNWLKTKLKASGTGALAVTAAVATIMAVAALIVEGQLTPGDVSWENAAAVFTLVFAASQARFRMLKDQQNGPGSP